MKKSILLVSAICASACAISACGKDKTPSAYDNLNSMLSASYSQISISIDNTFTAEDVTLESVYMLIYTQSQVTVQYKVERFSEISFENPTSDVKTTLEGIAVIAGDTVTGGSEVGLTADIAKLKMVFKEEYFENVTLAEGTISADVKDVKGFLGSDLTCTDMKVEAEFSNVFKNITVTYKQSGNEVEYRYVFA